MAHGGARENAGRNPKFRSATRLKRVPSGLSDSSIDACLRMLETLEDRGIQTEGMTLGDIINAYNQLLNY